MVNQCGLYLRLSSKLEAFGASVLSTRIVQGFIGCKTATSIWSARAGSTGQVTKAFLAQAHRPAQSFGVAWHFTVEKPLARPERVQKCGS